MESSEHTRRRSVLLRTTAEWFDWGLVPALDGCKIVALSAEGAILETPGGARQRVPVSRSAAIVYMIESFWSERRSDKMSKHTLAYTLCGPAGAEIGSGTADNVKELGQAIKAFVKAQAGEEAAGSIRFEFKPAKESKKKKKAKAKA